MSQYEYIHSLHRNDRVSQLRIDFLGCDIANFFNSRLFLSKLFKYHKPKYLYSNFKLSSSERTKCVLYYLYLKQCLIYG